MTKLHHHFNPVLLARKKSKEFDQLAYIIIGITFLIALPQVYQIYSTHSAGDISLLTFAGFLIIGVFWLIYGIERKLKPVIFSSLFHLLVNGAIVYGILLYGNVL